MIDTTQEMVKDILTNNIRARSDDFILYGAVLKRLGIDLKNTSLWSFLSTASEMNIVAFETVSRCRRIVQKNNPHLADENKKNMREKRQEDFINWNRRNRNE